MKKKLLLIPVLVLFLAQPAAAADYLVDKDHASIGFSVKHMVISNVKGHFTDFSGGFSFDENTKMFSKANLAVKVASIDTNVVDRDRHLRSPDFFDAEKFPEITFDMKRSQVLGDDTLQVTGDLTIHGVTREVVLAGEYLGSAKDPKGNMRAGFTATGKVNRGDFGLKWNKVLEAGGLLVGEEVKLLIEVEGILVN